MCPFDPVASRRPLLRPKNSIFHACIPPARAIIAGLPVNGRSEEERGSILSSLGTRHSGRNFLARELSTQGTAFAVRLLSSNYIYLKRLQKQHGLAFELPPLPSASQECSRNGGGPNLRPPQIVLCSSRLRSKPAQFAVSHQSEVKPQILPARAEREGLH